MTTTAPIKEVLPTFVRSDYKVEAQIKVVGQIEILQIAEDVFAYKRRVKLKKSEQTGDCKIIIPFAVKDGGSVTQGFVNAKDVERLLAGKPISAHLPLVLADPRLLEHLRLWGWQNSPDPKVKNYEHFDWKREDVYDALLEDPSLFERAVRLDSSSHMMFDWQDRALPVPVFFNYIDGMIAEDRYDLKKAAEILLARDDVVIFPVENGWGEGDRAGKATKVEQCISMIPGYNSERGRSQSMTFVYRPSIEDYRKMWEHCLVGGKAKYPSTRRHQAVFELDLLGLRAGGAARHDDFYGSTRPERDDNEDRDDD